LDAALAVGEGAALLQEAGAGQHDVRDLGGLRHEELLHHEEFERAEGLAHVQGVGIRLAHVLAADPHRFQLAGERGVIHLRDLLADDVRHVHAVEVVVELAVTRGSSTAK
jgi:hypothetical protein